MTESKPYKVELLNNCVTIVMAKSIRSARKWAQAEYGRQLEPDVTRASQDDIAWVRGAEGIIHEC